MRILLYLDIDRFIEVSNNTFDCVYFSWSNLMELGFMFKLVKKLLSCFSSCTNLE